MKIFIFALFLSFSALANDGLNIPHSFQVDKEGHIFRGKEPKKLVYELKNIGISDVIIIKNELKNEVQKEIAALKDLGIRPHHYDFYFTDIPNMETACEDVIEALNLIYKIKSNKDKVYFHCTLGEDRTGMLAGLYRMLEEGLTMKKVFKSEMCARGYSDGNPKKPGMVTAKIQRQLTPLFLYLASRIEDGTLTLGKASKRVCKDLKLVPTTLTCKSI